MELENMKNAEWEKWKFICALLKEAGAITAEDLFSPDGSQKTPGQKLLTEIARWGELVADLAIEPPLPPESKEEAKK